ncbi:MAG: DUF3810 domain-containing protein [Flavobacterium sp.]|nr:DUF3810 domain-containing protein [Flavobacterium sp.]
MNKRLILPILLFVQIVVVNFLSFFPEFVEKNYSNGLYPYIAKASRWLLGSVRFSVGDVIYFIVIFFLIRWLWNSRLSWRTKWQNNLLQGLGFLSVFYFLFHFLWAMNYHRVTLADKMSIDTEYDDAQLYEFTTKLIAKTNALHVSITNDSLSKVQVPHSRDQIFNISENGYRNLAKTYPHFEYNNPSVKKSLISLPLTYMGFGGYLNPFTNEAQVNDMLPMYSFAATSCHEMAHQIGYASESEANFVGFLAAVHNDDKYVKYSGYTLALRYCLRNWEIRNKGVAEELLATVNAGILSNFQESKDFWDGYETFIETGFKIFYDSFLKFNQQDEGLESYSKFVNLVVNYYSDREIP